jgi:transcriptional regulator with XRE-family HTH domain
MQLASPALAPHRSYIPHRLVSLMPSPGPMGRLVARKRAELGLTQVELSDRTASCGVGEEVPQNQISRLESGRIQRIQEPRRVEALARVLGLESDIEFILLACGPDGILDKYRMMAGHVEVLPAGPDDELIALVREIPRHRRTEAADILRVIARPKR